MHNTFATAFEGYLFYIEHAFQTDLTRLDVAHMASKRIIFRPAHKIDTIVASSEK
jgi:hypothetical protein